MYTPPRKYSKSIQTDIASGKIKPNLEATARVERMREQTERFDKHRNFINEKRGIKTIALFPKYSQRVINRMYNYLTNSKNAKDAFDVL